MTRLADILSVKRKIVSEVREKVWKKITGDKMQTKKRLLLGNEQ
jgi:hypothetical protein